MNDPLAEAFEKGRQLGMEQANALWELAKTSEAVDEFETRADGKRVRKDRWEWGIRRIVALMWGNRHEFEVDDVVDGVRKLVPEPVNDGDDEGLCRAVLREHTATPQPAAERVAPLSAADMQDLERLEGLFDDGEGWDLPKERMQRLAELGAIRRTGGNHYAITVFGMSCLHPDQCGAPLKTVAEWNAAALSSHMAAVGIGQQAKKQT